MKTLHFVQVIHSHQPVGNFDHVFEEAFTEAFEGNLVELSKLAPIGFLDFLRHARRRRTRRY